MLSTSINHFPYMTKKLCSKFGCQVISLYSWSFQAEAFCNPLLSRNPDSQFPQEFPQLVWWKMYHLFLWGEQKHHPPTFTNGLEGDYLVAKAHHCSILANTEHNKSLLCAKQ